MISESAPVNSGADREYPLEDGELWFKPSESCMRILIAATGKWSPIVSVTGVPGEPERTARTAEMVKMVRSMVRLHEDHATTNTWLVYELNSAGKFMSSVIRCCGDWHEPVAEHEGRRPPEEPPMMRNRPMLIWSIRRTPFGSGRHMRSRQLMVLAEVGLLPAHRIPGAW